MAVGLEVDAAERLRDGAMIVYLSGASSEGYGADVYRRLLRTPAVMMTYNILRKDARRLKAVVRVRKRKT